MTDILEWVAWLWRLGFWLAPADHPGLPECIGPRPCDGARGKHPHGSWGRKATNNPKLLRSRSYFGGGLRNIIVACKPSGLLVVDEDRLGALAEYAASIGQAVPDTFAVHTGRAEGGMHRYFRAPEGVELGNATGALKGYGVDVRGGAGQFGGYVIAPGSTHATGVMYEPVDMDAPVLPAPEWLIEALRPTPSALNAARRRAAGRIEHGSVAGLANWLATKKPGDRRNAALYWCACRAAEQNMPESAFEELVRVAVQIGRTEADARKTVASARRAVTRRSA